MEASSLLTHTRIIKFNLTAAPLETQSFPLYEGTKVPENSMHWLRQKKSEAEKLQNESLDSSLSEFPGDHSLLGVETRFSVFVAGGVFVFPVYPDSGKTGSVETGPELETVSQGLGHAWGLM